MRAFFIATLLALTSVLAQGDKTLYKCNPETFKCEECETSQIGCNFIKSCNLACGRFTPTDIIGSWRGIMVKKMDKAPTNDYDTFDQGELDLTFTEDKVHQKMAGNSTVSTCDVQVTQADSFRIVNCTSGSDMSFTYGQTGFLKHTTVVGITTFGNSSYPLSIQIGMKSNHTNDFVMFKCSQYASKSDCDFSPDMIKEIQEEKQQMIGQIDNEQHPLGKVQDDTCARCDIASATCEKCTCGSGIDCVKQAECNDRCTPKGTLYKCSWRTSPPQCVPDDSGVMNKPQCEQQCQPVQFGKCDYDSNRCVKCTQGTQDPDCVNLMTYCEAARKEGRCEKNHLTGLFRAIQANLPFQRGEYDIEFKDDKMYIVEYKKDKQPVEVGDLKPTGKTDQGGVTFEVTNWKPDSKVWPHEKLYGVYQIMYGELQLFNYLNLAFSEKPITTLDEGLHNGGRYFLGVTCQEKALGKKVCDFSSISPVPPSVRLGLDFTPAPEDFFYGFLQ